MYLWAIPIGYYFFRYSIKEIINKYLLMANPSQLCFLIMLFNVFVFFELFSDKIRISTKNLIILYITTTITGFGLSYLNIEYLQISKSIKYQAKKNYTQIQRNTKFKDFDELKETLDKGN